MPKVDTPIVRYRSLDGYLYNAKVLHREADVADIEVLIPGSSSTLRRSHIPLLDRDTGARAICFPVAA